MDDCRFREVALAYPGFPFRPRGLCATLGTLIWFAFLLFFFGEQHAFSQRLNLGISTNGFCGADATRSTIRGLLPDWLHHHPRAQRVRGELLPHLFQGSPSMLPTRTFCRRRRLVYPKTFGPLKSIAAAALLLPGCACLLFCRQLRARIEIFFESRIGWFLAFEVNQSS